MLLWGPAPPAPASIETLNPYGIELRHTKFDCYYVVHQRGLRERLEANGKTMVPVEFELTSSLTGWPTTGSFAIISVAGQPYAPSGLGADHGGCRESELIPFERLLEDDRRR